MNGSAELDDIVILSLITLLFFSLVLQLLIRKLKVVQIYIFPEEGLAFIGFVPRYMQWNYKFRRKRAELPGSAP